MITPAQLRAARALVGLAQTEVAARAGVSAMTVKRAEGSGSPPASGNAVVAIQGVLEAAGAVFLSENGYGPGVALRKV